jgi:hypothetical protein
MAGCLLPVRSSFMLQPTTDATLSAIQTPSQNTLQQASVKGNFHNIHIQGKTGFIYYFYRCTVHFEDSVIITRQQMH